jgi:hypothetical protein
LGVIQFGSTANIVASLTDKITEIEKKVHSMFSPFSIIIPTFLPFNSNGPNRRRKEFIGRVGTCKK